MNILILGGLGFLGRNLTKKLAERHNVFVADCVDYKAEKYYKIRIEDTKSIIEIIESENIDIVVHLVSTIIPSSGIEQYICDVNSIYMPTIQLLDYCADNKIKFVYFSSGGAVYGNQKEVFCENTKREPISFYGLSKLNLENAIQFFGNMKQLNYLIIRPSNPYGPGQNILGKQGIIAVIIGKILRNETIRIWGDGSATKDYIFIDDFVFYVSSLMEMDSVWQQIYNIGSGECFSVNDIIDTFKNIGIKMPEIRYVDVLQSDVRKMVLDCSKIKAIVPYKCKTLNQGIKLFWEYANSGR